MLLSKVRILSGALLLFALTQATCARKEAPSPSNTSSTATAPVLSPAELCEHLARQHGVDPQGANREMLRPCIESESAEQRLGADHWRCHATCVAGARSDEALEGCEAQCPLPPVKLDCDAILSASDVGEAFGGTATAVDSMVKEGFCARAFSVGGELVSISASVHKTMRGLYLFTEERTEPGTEVETLKGVGDRAVRYGAPRAPKHDCGVKFAQRRVGVNIVTAQEASGCPWNRLEKLAGRLASRLP